MQKHLRLKTITSCFYRQRIFMSTPAMAVADDYEFQKGVKHLFENGVSKLPNKYILPVSDRPNVHKENSNVAESSLQLPVIDFSELHGPNRSRVLDSLSSACEEYGFFQVVNHGIAIDSIRSMIDVSGRFFGLPYEERAKYMSTDMSSPVRYGTSFNQIKDSVFCWRDFLKLVCNPLSDVLPRWPSSPIDFREVAATYAKETKWLFLKMTEAILECLGGATTPEDDEILKQFKDGSQLMVVNCFPPCPEPELTLGMPPHSDYGFLTLLLQDEVEGLQIQYKGKWITVEPMANSFVVNVGDHLEIFSNGRYKSVLHRVVANPAKPRLSVASLHSLPFDCMVRPSPKLIDEENPRRYKDTDFATFLEYVSSCEPKKKNFLESRKLT
ncbi:protein DMR6-LIKE OXYGENASE 1-like [Hibiscus syriacus]|nr:protein DMR6-LIKE OXYGENASE 1-like [Hibiscus syriacus]